MCSFSAIQKIMKKKIVFAILFTTLFSTTANAELIMNYYEENVTTYSSGYRLDGKSDPKYPLYINDEKIQTTESGYFSKYVSLEDGENTFVIDNTTDKKTTNITKLSADDLKKVTYEDPFEKVDLIGKVNRKNPTVRTRPDEGNDDLLIPYTENTLLKIIGKNSEYYMTKNFRYIYIDAVDIVNDADYGENTATDVSFDTDNVIHISMNRATEYTANLSGGSLELELFDTLSDKKKINLDKKIFRNVSTKSFGTRTIYQFNFNEKNKFIGYFISFDENGMNIKLNERSEKKKGSLEGIDIVLDAGHGGDEPGTPGIGSIPEKTVTLNITTYLKDYLQEKGANIIMTRSDDTFLDLSERNEITTKNMPDAFISIHCNSLALTTDALKYSGIMGLYTFDSPGNFAESLNESIDFIACYKDNLAVTRNSVCPSILIETGFMSNPDEYEYLIKEENQKAIAEKIASATEKYFSQLYNEK